MSKYGPLSMGMDDAFDDSNNAVSPDFNSNSTGETVEKMIPEVARFDQFTTIDWIAEESTPVLLTNGALINVSNINDIDSNNENNGRAEFSRFGNYKKLIWERSRAVITLTLIAITIGCIAAFLQIFTETLVNWKTGHCKRNWILNKSFCCSIDLSEEGKSEDPVGKFVEAGMNFRKRMFMELSKREELDCVDDGLWVNRSGILAPFITFMLFSILFALASNLLVKYVAPSATGSGISEIKVWVSGFQYNDKFLNIVTLFVKSIALPLAISSGLSVGKEGPSVHYATCVGYVITNWLLKDVLTFSQQSEYLTATSAAGVAVAFGTPIGGVLFGLEEIAPTNEFKLSTLWKSYYVALGAVATLKFINPFRNGMIVLFNVTYDRYWKASEIPIFILLGIFGGLYGKYVSKWNIHYVQFRRKYLSSWPTQEVLILTVFTAFISYFNEFLKLDMTESMGILFHECSSLNSGEESTFSHRLCTMDKNPTIASFIQITTSLAFATIFRTIMVVMSYGAMIPAGIFVPSMAVGATFGRFVSLFVERIINDQSSITPGTYAFLGAAAALSGITNLTITVVVIMFELTGAFIYIIPTMMVVAITRLVLEHEKVFGGIADQMILVNGFPYIELDSEDTFMRQHTAEDIMTKDLKYLSETMNLSEIKDIVYSHAGSVLKGFPIIRDFDQSEPDKVMIGYVLKKHLLAKLEEPDFMFTDEESVVVNFIEAKNDNNRVLDEALSLINFSDVVNFSPITVKPNTPVSLLFRMFKQLGCKTIIVESQGIIKGLITVKDLLRFERSKHREIYGPFYPESEFLSERFWPIVKQLINRFR
ncbi:hypothetical protein TPHA_0B04040 [Tetrapisispora phaffii CBS 4417]|uniref:Chloride channel protein n=1 Tax=Tetrapisispora phaffii (strain ATCC 24235 / CBS 4417 / NBRC 1672 / NRRL Y-8282 / UCD 70-5) TaxID=1071381 RepID=G8BPZ5_TETPH|nr:hypothetical protein TPHA_0B04040 [Tetrapisispora phaffii CBS 4417]CCE62076.1 hypothetical protein TPHA_0B04040 [Tetrapisispora phaffii CBS 4417]